MLAHNKLPTIILSESDSAAGQLYNHPKEQALDRQVLLDVAPDRESLILSSKSLDEIRNVLKLHVVSPERHWLYRSQRRHDVKLRDATTRLSVFGSDIFISKENSNPTGPPVHVIRRVLSSSSLYHLGTSAMASIENRLDITEPAPNAQTWANMRLSTTDQLISPRPLSATHILLAYSVKPFSLVKLHKVGNRRIPRRARTTRCLSYPEVLEIPINDLLFLLNVPNISSSAGFGKEPASSELILPRRLHKELPRVLIQVPHLETFPELVIYLHTKDQTRLFGVLIPEWLRGIMHPLPSLQATVTATSEGNVTPTLNEGKNVLKLLNLFGLVSQDNFSSTRSLVSTSSDLEMSRTVDSIAQEVAEASKIFCSEADLENTLVQTAATLEALSDNLCHIGLFEKNLWNELDLCRDILIKAICHQAKVVDDLAK